MRTDSLNGLSAASSGMAPSDILAYVLVAVLVGILVFVPARAVYVRIRNRHWKKEFCEIYGIARLDLPDDCLIRWTGADVGNAYRLQFPSWVRPKKDGTRDQRVANNRVIWKTCQLSLEGWYLETTMPFAMVQLVGLLRKRNPDIEIRPCREEAEKISDMNEYMRRMSCKSSAEKIYKTYIYDPYGFEAFIADVYKKQGYDAHTTPKTNDGGYDVYAERDGYSAIIECKCYAADNKIGRPMIQKLVGANQIENADHMVFITTSSFSKEALEYAAKTGVQTIDGQQLVEMISKNTDNVEFRRNSSRFQLTAEDLEAYFPADIKVA